LTFPGVKIINYAGNSFLAHCPHRGIFTKIMGKAVRVSSNTPQLEPLDIIERFFASLRFDQRGKLDQLGIEIGSFE
jgi:hypothetical protein